METPILQSFHEVRVKKGEIKWFQFGQGCASKASEAGEVAGVNVRFLLVGGVFLRRFSKNSLKSVFGVSGGSVDVACIIFRRNLGSSC